MHTFSGKTYLVVGATSGIGKSVSSLLAEKGAAVVLIARHEEQLVHVQSTLTAGNHMVLPCDVADIEHLASHVDKAKGAYTVIDGMVFCVGAGQSTRLRDITFGDMRYLMQANCFSFLELVKNLTKNKPKMQPLRIVAISSLASTEFAKYLTLYAASKAALEASIRCLATEFGGRNVRINAIRPAFVDTPRLQHLNDITGNVEERLKENGYQPLGLISPADVAGMALYLLGDAASSFNGVCLPLNGGAAC